MPSRARFFQGRFEGGVVVDEVEVDEDFTNDIVQLLERVASYLGAEAFAVCAQIAVLSYGMHGADDGLVVDVVDEAVVVHFFEKGFARIVVVGNGTINERDDVLQRGSGRCAALRRKRQCELFGCIAGSEQLRKAGHAPNEIEVHSNLPSSAKRYFRIIIVVRRHGLLRNIACWSGMTFAMFAPRSSSSSKLTSANFANAS